MMSRPGQPFQLTPPQIEHCPPAVAALFAAAWVGKEIRRSCFGGKELTDRELRIVTKAFQRALKNQRAGRPTDDFIILAFVRYKAGVRGRAGYLDLLRIRHPDFDQLDKLEKKAKYQNLMRDVRYWRNQAKAERAKETAAKLGGRKGRRPESIHLEADSPAA